MYIIFKRSIALFFAILFIIKPTYARWANYNDAQVEVEFYNRSVKINGDGTSEAIVETKQKILKEDGRSFASNYTIHYNGDASKVTILEAKTISNGKEYKLDETMIEDKPLASAPQGFDQTRQILLSFPQVEINSEIYLKYKKEVTKPELEKVFSQKLYYGLDGYWKKSFVKLESELPLNIKVNDPEKVLKITKDKEENFHNLTINLLNPIYKQTTNEPRYSVINPKHETWVSISSLNSWNELATKLSEGYIKVLNQPLPNILKEILAAAKEKKDEIEQLNTVTSLLNDKIQYMGDWRSVSGRYFPKDLEKIAMLQIGDCKDFSISAGAILKQLGYKVQSALVMRGIGNLSILNGLPDLHDFNHAILKVTNKAGKVYWIDPTNYISMAQGMFSDISEKMVLILDPNEPSYEKTISIKPQHAEVIFTYEMDIDGDTVINSGNITKKGEEAFYFTGAALYLSEKQIKDSIFNALSGVPLEEEDKKELILPDLKSRIVKDISFKFKYNQKNQMIKTNVGMGIALRADWLYDFIGVTPDQISDIIIGPQRSIKKQLIINKRASQVEKLNYKMSNKWLDMERSCVRKDGKTIINETIDIKQMRIPNEDLKTTAFKNMKENLEHNLKNTLIIVND